ncbi:MAG: hypothetical protein BGO98_49570 [Myxococcales bacterium 68-20]|nr:MAG: hypothetical protein BGO98_49570 [Myxococcales bacterium 68-20]
MLLALSIGKTAQATASRFELTWTSASVERGCITQDELKQTVSARLGRDPFAPVGHGEIAVEGRELPATSGQLRARIVQRDRQGRVLGIRELEATSCEELRRSATFVVFLIVDPDAAFGGPTIAPARPEGEGVVEPPIVEELPHANGKITSGQDEQERRSASGGRASEVAVGARPPAPSAPGLRVDLGAALVVSNGLLPRPDVGPALALGVVPLALPIRLEWRASYRIAVQTVEGYDFRAVQQEWRACWFRRVLGPTFATACGGATWMAILPEAPDLARGDQAPKTLFSPTVAAGPAFEIGDTRLSVDLALAFPQPRYAFTYREEGRPMPLHEVSRIVWSLGIGASRSFR